MRAPYRNLDLEDGIELEEIDRKPGPSKELLALFMQDLMNKEKGKVAPDTTGADYFFLEEFITRDMELDFAVIEQDFLKHCSGRLQEFHDAGWYGEDEHWNNEPEYALKKKLLRLMYNGAKLGDSYCVELIKYLYKLYHKKEYNQLKRFTVISTNEILSLSEDEWGGNSYGTMGRILGMCRFMDIKQDDSCSILYLLLDKNRKEWIQDNEEQREYFEFEDELFEECIRQVEVWTKQDANQDIREFRKKNQEYFEGDAFVSACLRHWGYREDYIYMCISNNMGLSMQMTRALAVLKTMHPKREYTFEEVQRYTVLYSTVCALTEISDSFEIQLGYLIGEKPDEYEEEEILFKPENILERKSAEKKQPAPKTVANVAPISTGKASEDDYLKEISILRGKIDEQEQKIKWLKEQYRQVKQSQDEVDKLIKNYRAERDELIALREYVYKSELETPQLTEEKLADMKKVIADKAIVIIGGHINWINKLKQQFPNWMFIHPDSYKNVDGKIFEDKERVYFFTDYLNHASYMKFIAALRGRKVPFDYLGSRYVESMIRQVFEDTNPGR